MAASIDANEVILCVNEFYTTVDQDRRQQLNQMLCEFKKSFPCNQTITVCIHMMNRTNTANVQYFGAISLYDTIRERAEECISDVQLMESLKAFLISNLSESAAVQMQSVTNKLSSTLALLALYSIPDVWPEPVQDLTREWAATPELLLRVLAEIAAEFSNIKMPLTQRSVLKTSLLRISDEIILIIKTVMKAPDTSPSTRQAAVECVEQWVQLPGAGLDQWTDVLSSVFAAVSEDNTALTNLLNILAVNDELSHLEQLVLDICTFITQVASQKIAAELQNEGDSEEAVSLVSAVCCLAEQAVPTLLKHAKINNSTHLRDMCDLFARLSSWEGQYPVDESISDLPCVFWTTLREYLMQDRRQSILQSVSSFYAQVCRAAVTKLAYPPHQTFASFDEEQKEKFVMYRTNFSDVSINAYDVVGGSTTCDFFNEELEKFMKVNDFCRGESVLYCWELVADYLTDAEFPSICNCLQLCSQVTNVPRDVDGNRFLNTLMELLYGLSHLVQGQDEPSQWEMVSVQLVMMAMDRPACMEKALKSLEKYVQNRSPCLKEIGEHISNCCYDCFMNDSNPVNIRMLALNCIGYVLSMKRPSETMDIVNRMIAPHVSGLLEVEQIQDEHQLQTRLFQIQIFSSLFATLQKKSDQPVEGESVIVSILKQAMPVFKLLLAAQGIHKKIGNKVCESVRSAIGNLSPTDLVVVFPFIVETIEFSLLSNTESACSLAKTAVIMCNTVEPVVAYLCSSLSKWFALFQQNPTHADMEEWLGLIYSVFRKDWKMLRTQPEPALAAIASAIDLCGNILISSAEPSLVRLSSQILATVSSQTTSFGDEAPKQILANNGPLLVKAIFSRLQSEVQRNTIEPLAEALLFFVQYYPQETRAVMATEGFDDSPIVAAMFREVGNMRNFKKMAIRLNQSCRKVVTN